VKVEIEDLAEEVRKYMRSRGFGWQRADEVYDFILKLSKDGGK